VADLLIYLFFAALGGFIGWQARDLRAEREQDLREQQRDDEWDAKHFGEDRG
jgi:hypothetical protein